MTDDAHRRYPYVKRKLERHDYHRLPKPEKSRVREAIMRHTNLSRATLTRLIRQHRETGEIRDGRRLSE